MRAARATLVVAIVALLSGASVTHASTTDVHVRIEGAAGTIFDRAVQVDGHAVRATSDVQVRRCDGTNNGANPTPGPTATSAAVDALASIGQTFDGQWYPGYDDYFVTRLGPEREDNDKLWWWGILVNRLFTPVGGCQFQLHDGDEVLWVLDAFSSRPFLWLSGPASTPAGQAPTVLVDRPLNVVVSSTASSTELDQTSGPPYAGAQVAAVDANGQPAAPGVADGATSAADGIATVTFHTAGWRRLKARAPGSGGTGSHPVAIASNSIDVCVEAMPGVGCAGSAPGDRPIVLPPGGGGRPRPAGDRVLLARPRLTLDPRHGRVEARWSVRDAGRGIRDWAISSQVVGRGGFVARAGGGPSATRASLRLPAGVASRVRLTVRDTAGRSASLTLGRVLVPRDDRTLPLGAGWSRKRDRGAWMGTVTRGTAGAQLTLRLGHGRPVFLLRGGRGRATVELRVGGRMRRVAVAGDRTWRLLGPRLASAGAVELRVRAGTVSVDGIGLAP